MAEGCIDIVLLVKTHAFRRHDPKIGSHDVCRYSSRTPSDFEEWTSLAQADTFCHALHNYDIPLTMLAFEAGPRRL